MENKAQEQEIKKPIRLSSDEALSFLIEGSFTKEQYNGIRNFTKKMNIDLYPSYQRLIKSIKKCRPEGIQVTETVAEVSLQNMLNHIAKRIIMMQEKIFNDFICIEDVKLIVSYDFDIWSGHNMCEELLIAMEPNEFDQPLFVASVIPLRMVDSLGRNLWINNATQSFRFCRPLKIELTKASKEYILKEKNNLDVQIENLNPFIFVGFSEHGSISVRFQLSMNFIDNNIINIVKGIDYSQSCTVCGATTEDLLSTKDIYAEVFKPKPNTQQHKVSPLHSYVKFFEFVLNISYRIGINKWQIKNKSDKQKMMLRKKNIQKKLSKEMGLHVDREKKNGNEITNDGFTARLAFLDVQRFASILNFDVDILKGFHTILKAISSDYQINPHKFEEFCKKIFNSYMNKYSWYPMSSTVHKILVHGSQMISASAVPVVCLGDRLPHTQHNYRIYNMMDMFYRAMDATDPLISTLSLSKRTHHNKRKLPLEALALLEDPTFVRDDEEEDYESDSDLDDDYEKICSFSFELEVEDN